VALELDNVVEKWREENKRKVIGDRAGAREVLM